MTVPRPRADHAFMVLAYGDSPFLADCLGSLQGQTVASQIVVATSTPSPHIERAAENAGAPLLVNPQRRSIGADWNFALAAAAQRFVTLAHQDDLYHPEFLARTLAALAACPEAVLCFTDASEVDDAGRTRRTKVGMAKAALTAAILDRRVSVAGWRQRLFLSFGNPLACSSVTFDRARIPDFRFSEDLSSNLDWEAWWRLHREGRTFAHSPHPLIGRRSNELSATARLKRSGARRREDLAMFERIWPRPIGQAIACLYRAGY